MSCNHRKFSRDEVLSWIKDMRIDRPWFCAVHGRTFIVERLSKCGSTVYEFCWNNSKTPIDNPRLAITAWSFGVEESDIPDALYYADDETEAAIEAIEEAE
jgi:hypothetical protein